jgi:hypothetical protein
MRTKIPVGPTEEEWEAYAERSRDANDRAMRLARDETSNLPPYDAEGTCPKCGSVRVDVDHKGLMVEYPGYYYMITKWWNETPLFYFHAEHILRTCGRCTHTWKERPLDFEVPDA